MGKGIAAHDGLVGLHRQAGQLADQAADRVDAPGVDARIQAEQVAAGAEGHDHLFQRCIARPLADAVDRHLHLPRPGPHPGQRIGRGHAQVVVAVDRDGRPVDVGHMLDDAPDERAKLLRRGVAGRIGDVDHRRPGVNDRFQHPVEILRVGAARILGVVLHILDELFGVPDRVHAPRQRLFRRHA